MNDHIFDSFLDAAREPGDALANWADDLAGVPSMQSGNAEVKEGQGKAEPAAADTSGTTMIIVLVAVGVVFLVLFYILNRRKQQIQEVEEEKKDKDVDVSPEEYEEKKDELSLAEIKKAKQASTEDLSKEELRKLRKERRAQRQTAKAKSKRDKDADDAEDEEPISDEEARAKDLDELLDSSVSEEEDDDDMGFASPAAEARESRKSIPSLGSGLIDVDKLEEGDEVDEPSGLQVLEDLEKRKAKKKADEEAKAKKDEDEDDVEDEAEPEDEEDKAEPEDKADEEDEVEPEDKADEEDEVEPEDKADEEDEEDEVEPEDKADEEDEEDEEDEVEPEAEVEPEEKAEPEDEEPTTTEKAKSLRDGLSQTRNKGFVARLGQIFGKKLDDSVVEELEEILFTADIGVQTSEKLLDLVSGKLSRKEVSDGDKALAALREEVRTILTASEKPLEIGEAPHVILVVGVNGAGKTTTIGKLAAKLKDEGKKVLLVAGDTFRAAAIEQLQEWGERTDCAVHTDKQGADPSAVIFDGLKQAEEEGYDVVLADTAGRLHNKKDLVEELKKINRVAGKSIDGAPHQTLLVLDATNGQNALMQAKEFKEAVDYTGIVMTKLDGTAKGGVIIGICDEMKVPVHYIGIGEMIDDLRPFSADEFVDALF